MLLCRNFGLTNREPAANVFGPGPENLSIYKALAWNFNFLPSPKRTPL